MPDHTLPPAAPVPLRGGPAVRWGVIGAGRIAGAFATALHSGTDQRVVAIASRTVDRAAALAATAGIDRVHADVQMLLDDPAVDVVYLATPNSSHLELGLLALE